ncbi:MAG TPA: FAD-dependent oxidoreductase [Ornithinimicrobium sp.]|uniref:NAD(P)/FAD-dependent oxidoreductase n=1 Tax=Ornithinimicrobium sp. TaxID=1977084 RepID=UPI002B4809B1|nr:FAD-dependent oxidoreductase [Ornithinimicrobium sp.]HKJ12926.1 FAD-dependent oxidoreductase [Ornithinimicrobium sp.]
MTGSDAAPVVIVGAGLAGLSCARHLQQAGVDPVVVDRGRRVGGRMAVSSVHGRAVDTGASYFTVGEEPFATVVGEWERRGLARPWTDTFDVVRGTRFEDPTTGGMRWAAPGGLRTLVEDLASRVHVRHSTVDRVQRSGEGTWSVGDVTARAVVLAMPDPQARRLLGEDLEAERHRLDVGYDPVLALCAGWTDHAWRDAGAGDVFEGAFVNDHESLSWIADDGRRRGDDAPVLVAHSTPSLASAHLAEPQTAEPVMLEALRAILDIRSAPSWTRVKRWSYAKPSGRREVDHWLSGDGLGFCGDSWSSKPRVEAAYSSGVAMASSLLAAGLLS